MAFLAERVVLLAELDQLAQLALEELGLLAHRDQLPLADRDRAPAVGMRHLQVHEDVHVVLEEPRVLPQEFGDLVRGERHLVSGPFQISISPSKTRTASPVIITAAPSTSHPIERPHPRRGLRGPRAGYPSRARWRPAFGRRPRGCRGAARARHETGSLLARSAARPCPP